MTEGTWIILAALGPFLGLGIGFFFGKGRKLAELADLASLGKDIPSLLLEHEKSLRKSEEYLGKIEEVIMEREQWRELYNDQSSGHDNAQALMLQTITALSQRYQKDTGKPAPRLDPLIEKVREEWTGRHGVDARAERLDDGKQRKESPPEAT